MRFFVYYHLEMIYIYLDILSTSCVRFTPVSWTEIRRTREVKDTVEPVLMGLYSGDLTVIDVV